MGVVLRHRIVLVDVMIITFLSREGGDRLYSSVYVFPHFLTPACTRTLENHIISL